MKWRTPGEKKNIYLHRSGPLLENGLGRPENCRYGLASFLFQNFHVYCRGGWSQSFPLKIFFSCSLGGRGRCFSVPWTRSQCPNYSGSLVFRVARLQNEIAPKCFWFPNEISGPQKRPAERGHVKNRQRVSKTFSTLFDNFRAAPVFRPLLGGSDEKRNEKFEKGPETPPKNVKPCPAA